MKRGITLQSRYSDYYFFMTVVWKKKKYLNLKSLKPRVPFYSCGPTCMGNNLWRVLNTRVKIMIISDKFSDKRRRPVGALMTKSLNCTPSVKCSMM